MRKYLLFLLLAALWGASFIFQRVISPELGAFATACARALIAGIFLTGLFAILRQPMYWRSNWRHYLVVGILNAVLPFSLYSFAASRLPSAIPAIINALTPLWGAIFAALILKEKFTLQKILGLGLGLMGVSLIALRGNGLSTLPDPLAVAACVLATICYGLAGSYIKRWANTIPSRSMTAANLLIAGLILLPLGIGTLPPLGQIGPEIWGLAIVFALLCSALAYLIYYQLIQTAGVTLALSVTLVIPVFAFLWGFIFLGERINLIIALGALLVLGGTWLVIGPQGKAKST